MTIVPLSVDEVVPGARPEGVDDDTLLSLYGDMARVRSFEEEVIDAFSKGLIPGSTHPCIGAEGIKAGALSALRPDDLVFATYRGHGEALIKGVDPVSMMAELMGRATGVCKGKGGSMHLSEPSVGLVSTNAIVAGHIPMAGGAALSCRFRETGQIVLCFFGDGASCEGEFFEAMNMAMLWKVPLVFTIAQAASACPPRSSTATTSSPYEPPWPPASPGLVPTTAPRSWSARRFVGSGTPRSLPAGPIPRSSDARGSASTRSSASGSC
jgi:TPP-dependent pyruvate/acetoin dehydrogenase alpha subunit